MGFYFVIFESIYSAKHKKKLEKLVRFLNPFSIDICVSQRIIYSTEREANKNECVPAP